VAIWDGKIDIDLPDVKGLGRCDEPGAIGAR